MSNIITVSNKTKEGLPITGKSSLHIPVPTAPVLPSAPTAPALPTMPTAPVLPSAPKAVSTVYNPNITNNNTVANKIDSKAEIARLVFAAAAGNDKANKALNEWNKDNDSFFINKLVKSQSEEFEKKHPIRSLINAIGYVIPATIEGVAATTANDIQYAMSDATNTEKVVRAVNTFNDDMDLLANPIKGAIIEKSKGKSLIKGFEKGLLGEEAYIYDTGNWMSDMALELISDPNVLGDLIRVAGKTIASKVLGKAMGNAGVATIERALREGVTNMSQEEIELILREARKELVDSNQMTAMLAKRSDDLDNIISSQADGIINITKRYSDNIPSKESVIKDLRNVLDNTHVGTFNVYKTANAIGAISDATDSLILRSGIAGITGGYSVLPYELRQGIKATAQRKFFKLGSTVFKRATLPMEEIAKGFTKDGIIDLQKTKSAAIRKGLEDPMSKTNIYAVSDVINQIAEQAIKDPDGHIFTNMQELVAKEGKQGAFNYMQDVFASKVAVTFVESKEGVKAIPIKIFNLSSIDDALAAGAYIISKPDYTLVAKAIASKHMDNLATAAYKSWINKFKYWALFSYATAIRNLNDILTKTALSLGSLKDTLLYGYEGVKTIEEFERTTGILLDSISGNKKLIEAAFDEAGEPSLDNLIDTIINDKYIKELIPGNANSKLGNFIPLEELKDMKFFKSDTYDELVTRIRTWSDFMVAGVGIETDTGSKIADMLNKSRNIDKSLYGVNTSNNIINYNIKNTFVTDPTYNKFVRNDIISKYNLSDVDVVSTEELIKRYGTPIDISGTLRKGVFNKPEINYAYKNGFSQSYTEAMAGNPSLYKINRFNLIQDLENGTYVTDPITAQLSLVYSDLQHLDTAIDLSIGDSMRRIEISGDLAGDDFYKQVQNKKASFDVLSDEDKELITRRLNTDRHLKEQVQETIDNIDLTLNLIEEQLGVSKYTPISKDAQDYADLLDIKRQLENLITDKDELTDYLKKNIYTKENTAITTAMDLSMLDIAYNDPRLVHSNEILMVNKALKDRAAMKALTELDSMSVDRYLDDFLNKKFPGTKPEELKIVKEYFVRETQLKNYSRGIYQTMLDIESRFPELFNSTNELFKAFKEIKNKLADPNYIVTPEEVDTITKVILRADKYNRDTTYNRIATLVKEGAPVQLLLNKVLKEKEAIPSDLNNEIAKIFSIKSQFDNVYTEYKGTQNLAKQYFDVLHNIGVNKDIIDNLDGSQESVDEVVRVLYDKLEQMKRKKITTAKAYHDYFENDLDISWLKAQSDDISLTYTTPDALYDGALIETRDAAIDRKNTNDMHKQLIEAYQQELEYWEGDAAPLEHTFDEIEERISKINKAMDKEERKYATYLDNLPTTLTREQAIAKLEEEKQKLQSLYDLYFKHKTISNNFDGIGNPYAREIVDAKGNRKIIRNENAFYKHINELDKQIKALKAGEDVSEISWIYSFNPEPLTKEFETNVLKRAKYNAKKKIRRTVRRYLNRDSSKFYPTRATQTTSPIDYILQEMNLGTQTKHHNAWKEKYNTIPKNIKSTAIQKWYLTGVGIDYTRTKRLDAIADFKERLLSNKIYEDGAKDFRQYQKTGTVSDRLKSEIEKFAKDYDKHIGDEINVVELSALQEQAIRKADINFNLEVSEDLSYLFNPENKYHVFNSLPEGKTVQEALEDFFDTIGLTATKEDIDKLNKNYDLNLAYLQYYKQKRNAYLAKKNELKSLKQNAAAQYEVYKQVYNQLKSKKLIQDVLDLKSPYLFSLMPSVLREAAKKDRLKGIILLDRWGKPLHVYHGTSMLFDTFEDSYIHSAYNTSDFGLGHYGTLRAKGTGSAQEYAAHAAEMKLKDLIVQERLSKETYRMLPTETLIKIYGLPDNIPYEILPKKSQELIRQSIKNGDSFKINFPIDSDNLAIKDLKGIAKNIKGGKGYVRSGYLIANNPFYLTNLITERSDGGVLLFDNLYKFNPEWGPVKFTGYSGNLYTLEELANFERLGIFNKVDDVLAPYSWVISSMEGDKVENLRHVIKEIDKYSLENNIPHFSQVRRNKGYDVTLTGTINHMTSSSDATSEIIFDSDSWLNKLPRDKKKRQQLIKRSQDAVQYASYINYAETHPEYVEAYLEMMIDVFESAEVQEYNALVQKVIEAQNKNKQLGQAAGFLINDKALRAKESQDIINEAMAAATTGKKIIKQDAYGVEQEVATSFKALSDYLDQDTINLLTIANGGKPLDLDNIYSIKNIYNFLFKQDEFMKTSGAPFLIAEEENKQLARELAKEDIVAHLNSFIETGDLRTLYANKDAASIYKELSKSIDFNAEQALYESAMGITDASYINSIYTIAERHAVDKGIPQYQFKNIWNNFIDEVKTKYTTEAVYPERILDLLDEQAEGNRFFGLARVNPKATESLEHLIDLAKDKLNRLDNTSFAKKAKELYTKYNPLAYFGEFERFGRTGQYIGLMNLGYKKYQALTEVINTHFDYSMKSNFVGKLELLIPFVTFPIENLKYWAKQIDTNPVYVLSMLRLREANYKMRERNDFELEKNKGLMYNYNVGNLVLGNIEPGKGNTVLKLNPSMYDALGILQNPLGSALEKSILPIELTNTSPGKYDNVWPEQNKEVQFNLPISKNHALTFKPKDIVNAIPFVGSMGTRVSNVVNKVKEHGVSLSSVMPTMFGYMSNYARPENNYRKYTPRKYNKILRNKYYPRVYYKPSTNPFIRPVAKHYRPTAYTYKYRNNNLVTQHKYKSIYGRGY